MKAMKAVVVVAMAVLCFTGLACGHATMDRVEVSLFAGGEERQGRQGRQGGQGGQGRQGGRGAM